MIEEPPTHVVSLELDSASFAWLNDLRQRHFPAALNHLDAHLTLFHKVDEEGIAAIRQVTAEHSGAPIPLSFHRLRNLGRGVAIEVEAPRLVAMHAAFAKALAGRLTRQDEQPFRPHVTIQNKVQPAAARDLLQTLGSTFTARTGTGTAVLIWDYLGGPWLLRQRMAFGT